MARFAKILPEYKAAPQITRERLYIETMEKVLSNTRKVLVKTRRQQFDGSAAGSNAERW